MKEMLVDTKDVVTVKMLGGFSVYVGEKLIVANDAGGQIWNLLEYLLVNRHKPVTQEQMMEVLWDDEVEDPAAALKNLVYRLRKEFTVAGVSIAKQMVLSSGGVYHWNNSVPTEIDVEKYETLCQQASEEQDPAAHTALARAALDLYSGDFLPGAYHRAWITPLNRYYHALYFKQAYALLAEYEESENWVEMLNVASKAVEIDCFEEDGHRYVLQALSKLGRQTQAISYYNYVSDLFYREMGVDLSAKLRQMFSEIAKTVKINSLDLAGLKQDLRENDQVSGAYYCEYEIFKSLYRVRARDAAREGVSVFLGLLTLSGAQGIPLEQNVRHQAMQALHRAVYESLRVGDVYSRCTGSQYIVMLPRITFENGEMVLGRITKRFKNTYHSRKVAIVYNLQPIDPIAQDAEKA